MRDGRDPRPAAQEPINTLVRALRVDLRDDERARLYASDRDVADDVAGCRSRAARQRGAQRGQPGPVVGRPLGQAGELAGRHVARSRGGVGGGSLAWIATTLRLEVDRPRGDQVEAVSLRLRATLRARAPPAGRRAGLAHVQVARVGAGRRAALLAVIDGDATAIDDAEVPAAPLPWQQACAGGLALPAPP